MPNNCYNWTFKDIEKFLGKHGFVLKRINGSHYFFVGKINEVDKLVCVPFHTNKAIDPRVLKGVICQSGIDKKEWIQKR